MLQPGILFDNRYELIRMLGRGGFAEVWLVKDTLTDLEEALKIYAPGGGMDEDGLKIFVKELTVVHDLHHPNLLTPKMLGQYEHQPYLVLQYCPNGSLNKMVGHCTEGEAWKILEQVADGLAYLHKRAIVHQDIKPDNILVDANLDYVITDFGISLKAQSTLRKSVRIQANSGTMAYMAPERFSAEPHPIPANDIWSLGAMMFELVEGNVPFIAQMGGLAQMNGAQLPTMHAGVSNNLKQVIATMLALNPEDRPTAEEIVELAKTKSAPKNQPSETPADEKKTRIINTAPVDPKEWVDLGLPSGTLWKKENQPGIFYTFDEVVAIFSDQLPTKDQLEELKDRCNWTWTGKGYKVVGPNGNSITLPAAGCRDCDGDVALVGMFGEYWSSTPFDSKNAWCLDFHRYGVKIEHGYRCDGLSVRLVR